MKQVTYRGVVAVQDGRRLTHVAFTDCSVDGVNSTFVEPLPARITKQEFAEKFFPVGATVRVRSNAAEIKPILGSATCRKMTEARRAAIGQIGQVTSVDTDGDVLISGLGRNYWPPELLEVMAPPPHRAFQVGDRVVCERKPTDPDYVAWCDDKTARLGMVGAITDLGALPNTAITVTYPDGQTWQYKPHWLRPVSTEELLGHEMLQAALANLRKTGADATAVAGLVERQLKRPRTE